MQDDDDFDPEKAESSQEDAAQPNGKASGVQVSCSESSGQANAPCLAADAGAKHLLHFGQHMTGAAAAASPLA